MTRSHWTITTDLTGRRRDVDVFLYDKLSHLRAAATRHSKAWEPDFEPLVYATAVCHGFRGFRINPDGSEEERTDAAILRFARGHVTPVIVAHEVVHAAQHLYGLDCLTTDSAKDHFTVDNERFAYLVGDLFNTVFNLFHEPIEANDG